MLKRLTPREQFELLVSQWEPVIRKAFLDAIADIKSNVVMKRVVERMERGDVAGAIEAMDLDATAFRTLDKAIAETFEGGGIASTSNMPTLRDPEGHAFTVRFDVRNIVAENWIRDHSSQLVTNIIADQRNSIRQALEAGLERGMNPRTTALDVVGRIDTATGRRTGGVLGLTAQQELFSQKALGELLSGDEALLRHYLTRERRDKRFDRTVSKAIRDGKPIPAETVQRMIGRYRDNLLKLRGDTIARTETMAALGQSNIEAYRQAIADGKVSASVVFKIWHSTPDGRTRHTHRVMNKQKVSFDGKFQSRPGVFLAYPCDPDAPVEETVNCRCFMQVKIDHLAGIE